MGESGGGGWELLFQDFMSRSDRLKPHRHVTWIFWRKTPTSPKPNLYKTPAEIAKYINGLGADCSTKDASKG